MAHRPWGSVPSEAIKNQPQPVEQGQPKAIWQENGWKECYVGPSEPASDLASETTLTHRRAAHMARDTQGGYADLVCISAVVASFLQGASDFLVSMAPLLIIYEVYGADGSQGGLDWSLSLSLTHSLTHSRACFGLARSCAEFGAAAECGGRLRLRPAQHRAVGGPAREGGGAQKRPREARAQVRRTHPVRNFMSVYTTKKSFSASAGLPLSLSVCFFL